MERLISNIEKYINILSNYCPKIGTNFPSIPVSKTVLLDILTANRKLIKSLYYLLNSNDKDVDVPVYIICRSLMANCLSVYYFTAFVNADGELDNDALLNELTAIGNLEYLPYTHKVAEYLGAPKLERPKRSLKWIDYHADTDPFILDPLKEARKNGNILSEESKYRFALIKHPEARHVYINNTYILYKTFSQFYHYNTIGGEWGRRFNKNRLIHYTAHTLLASMDSITLCMRPLKDLLPCEQTLKDLNDSAIIFNEISHEHSNFK